jgi:nicotinamide riboside kinase
MNEISFQCRVDGSEHQNIVHRDFRTVNGADWMERYQHILYVVSYVINNQI